MEHFTMTEKLTDLVRKHKELTYRKYENYMETGFKIDYWYYQIDNLVLPD